MDDNKTTNGLLLVNLPKGDYFSGETVVTFASKSNQNATTLDSYITDVINLKAKMAILDGLGITQGIVNGGAYSNT